MQIISHQNYLQAKINDMSFKHVFIKLYDKMINSFSKIVFKMDSTLKEFDL